ncbi:hypothetical protein DEU56DRAFT_754501 [Suillus clintonianus]|uniref:uncharacterized protein n=1 Tax=Suillus clintonianus TaxID=1904413 RepID=UPI001B885273|nr:uncharacterized protein DEU56DRAFT_754501 [Suillus clintonianus]KAG2143707.1 hypothetical protein DEU56DRAFT_754501 [Suillus clintonianus]
MSWCKVHAYAEIGSRTGSVTFLTKSPRVSGKLAMDDEFSKQKEVVLGEELHRDVVSNEEKTAAKKVENQDEKYYVASKLSLHAPPRFTDHLTSDQTRIDEAVLNSTVIPRKMGVVKFHRCSYNCPKCVLMQEPMMGLQSRFRSTGLHQPDVGDPQARGTQPRIHSSSRFMNYLADATRHGRGLEVGHMLCCPNPEVNWCREAPTTFSTTKNRWVIEVVRLAMDGQHKSCMKPRRL